MENLRKILKRDGVPVAEAARRIGVNRSVFYDVFRGRFDGFSAANARRIIGEWPDRGLEWEDLLFYRERFLAPPAPATEEQLAAAHAAVQAAVAAGQAHPEARRIVLEGVARGLEEEP